LSNSNPGDDRSSGTPPHIEDHLALSSGPSLFTPSFFPVLRFFVKSPPTTKAVTPNHGRIETYLSRLLPIPVFLRSGKTSHLFFLPSISSFFFFEIQGAFLLTGYSSSRYLAEANFPYLPRRFLLLFRIPSKDRNALERRAMTPIID